jgi:hypothetical protein
MFLASVVPAASFAMATNGTPMVTASGPRFSPASSTPMLSEAS